MVLQCGPLFELGGGDIAYRFAISLSLFLFLPVSVSLDQHVPLMGYQAQQDEAVLSKLILTVKIHSFGYSLKKRE